MNVERLQQLRRVVEAAPEERFKMAKFCEATSCGTNYCAAGWAAIDPWFRENTDINKIFSVSKLKSGLYVNPINPADTFEHLASLFDITEGESDTLFNGVGETGITKAEVLEKIDALIAGDDINVYGYEDDDEDDEG